MFGDFVIDIHSIELEIKKTTDTARHASIIDIHREIDNEDMLRSEIYDTRDDFNFPIVHFPFICSNIPATPAYGVYISQLILLIRYSRACGFYGELHWYWVVLTRTLLNQEFPMVMLKSSL